jgi:hypothetical protein
MNHNRMNYQRSKICDEPSDTRRVNLVTNPVISHKRGKDREVLTTSGTYPCSFVTQIFYSGSHEYYHVHADDGFVILSMMH